MSRLRMSSVPRSAGCATRRARNSTEPGPAPGIWLHQLTDDDLSLELTARGARHYKDSALN